MNICKPICVCVLKYVLNSIWYITSYKDKYSLEHKEYSQYFIILINGM